MPKIASKIINLKENNANLTTEFAERIYEIRCRAVHTKVSEKNYSVLLPSSPELKNLWCDILVLGHIAKRALITGSRSLRI